MLHLSGISLTRSPTAPQRVSEAGEKAIADNEEVKSASETIETLRKSILDKHISIAAAPRPSDPLEKGICAPQSYIGLP
jgi:hypothetical protein